MATDASPSPAPVIRQATVEEIRPLRHAVLRPGLPLATAAFPGDELTTTVHLAADIGSRIVGCASWMRGEFSGEPAYQLRGMAVDEAWRGSGLGQRLLAASDDLLPIGLLRWCNARMTAVGFYQRHGWTIVSPVFDIPTAGPHCRMTSRR